MTLIERNQRLYELRQKLHEYNTKVAWIKQEIMVVNAQYQRQFETPLFEELFGG